MTQNTVCFEIFSGSSGLKIFGGLALGVLGAVGVGLLAAAASTADGEDDTADGTDNRRRH